MPATFRFIADPSEPSDVLKWFRELGVPPAEYQGKRSNVMLYFKDQGNLFRTPDDRADLTLSPVVNLFLPEVHRGVLWTVGEVHFLTRPLRKHFPALYKISVAFKEWLSLHQCVFSSGQQSEFDYCLEGNCRGYGDIYALPSGLAAIRHGQYFVGDSDNDYVLDRVCKTLRLRGIDCVPQECPVAGSSASRHAEKWLVKFYTLTNCRNSRQFL